MSRIFGRLCQNGYVVSDLEQALDHWTRIVGVGPFFCLERAPFGDLRYRGEPSAAEVSVAVSASGPVQIELIAPRGDGPSVWHDFLAAGHEGLHHVSYWTETFDDDLARHRAAGYEVVQSGWTGDASGRFVYYDTGAGFPGGSVELSEVTGAKRQVFEAIAQQARDWDGTAPVRRVDG